MGSHPMDTMMDRRFSGWSIHGFIHRERRVVPMVEQWFPKPEDKGSSPFSPVDGDGGSLVDESFSSSG